MRHVIAASNFHRTMTIILLKPWIEKIIWERKVKVLDFSTSSNVLLFFPAFFCPTSKFRQRQSITMMIHHYQSVQTSPPNFELFRTKYQVSTVGSWIAFTYRAIHSFYLSFSFLGKEIKIVSGIFIIIIISSCLAYPFCSKSVCWYFKILYHELQETGRTVSLQSIVINWLVWMMKWKRKYRFTGREFESKFRVCFLVY